MKTVVFSIRSLEASLADFSDAWKRGTPDEAAHIGFASWELMHKVLSPKRLEIVRTLTGAGPLGIREVARRVGRDFKGVHSDLALLIQSGVVDRNENGKVVFPYERIHVDFEIPAAA
jgi:predicted transcriptional regulator